MYSSPKEYLENDNNENEYPLFQTPNGKTIEVRPDGVHGLWVINPHSTNLPAYLKGVRFVREEDACKEVLKWIETIKVKQGLDGKTDNSKSI